MADICQIGAILEAEDGDDLVKLRRVEGRYDYTGAPCKCPICGGLGVPWGGWFHCDSKCSMTVALVNGGACFEIVDRIKGGALQP